MKHWDGLDRQTADPLRLSRRDQARLVQLMGQAPLAMRPRRQPANGASVVGLLLSVAMLAGLMWALWPDSPVAPEVLR